MIEEEMLKKFFESLNSSVGQAHKLIRVCTQVSVSVADNEHSKKLIEHVKEYNELVTMSLSSSDKGDLIAKIESLAKTIKLELESLLKEIKEHKAESHEEHGKDEHHEPKKSFWSFGKKKEKNKDSWMHTSWGSPKSTVQDEHPESKHEEPKADHDGILHVSDVEMNNIKIAISRIIENTKYVMDDQTDLNVYVGTIELLQKHLIGIISSSTNDSAAQVELKHYNKLLLNHRKQLSEYNKLDTINDFKGELEKARANINRMNSYLSKFKKGDH